MVDAEFVKGKLKEKKGSERVLPAQLALIAAGFLHPQKAGIVEQLGLALDERGNIKTSDFQTNRSGVFASGDARRGQSLVVWAIAEGRQMAESVNAFLHASA